MGKGRRGHPPDNRHRSQRCNNGGPAQELSVVHPRALRRRPGASGATKERFKRGRKAPFLYGTTKRGQHVRIRSCLNVSAAQADHDFAHTKGTYLKRCPTIGDIGRAMKRWCWATLLVTQACLLYSVLQDIFLVPYRYTQSEGRCLPSRSDPVPGACEARRALPQAGP